MATSQTTVNTNSSSTVNLDVVVDIATTIASELATKVVDETVKKAVKQIERQEKFPQPSTRLQRIAEPSMTSYVNLYNNHRSVLKPDKVHRLEQKVADIRKYSEIISDDLKVLIVDKANGITQSQASILQNKIKESLETYVAANKDKEVPRFLETSYAFMCVKVVCANEFTVQWLTDIISKLQPPPWTGAKLQVTVESSYSMFSAVSTRRAVKPKPRPGRIKFAVPHPVEIPPTPPPANAKQANAQQQNTQQQQQANAAPSAQASTQPQVSKATKKKTPPPPKLTYAEVAKRIEMCNPPLKTEHWEELLSEEKNKHTIFYVAVKKESLEEIRKRGNRLFYLLGTVKILPLNEMEEIACNKAVKEKNKSKAAP